MAISKIFKDIQNYLYLYHIDQFIVIPVYPDSVSDTMNANFSSTTPLLRSAPIYSYQSSGPRSVQVSFELHRDMMYQVNHGVSNAILGEHDDYVDTFVKLIQAAAVPEYAASSKMVNPPIVALRLGNEVFCKGVISSGIGVTYGLPVLRVGKYATVTVNFTINEIDPYDASTLSTVGSFRGIDTSLERTINSSLE